MSEIKCKICKNNFTSKNECEKCNNLCINCEDELDEKCCLCEICYTKCVDRFYLECCKIPIICMSCIDYLDKPLCPFCRSPIKSLLESDKYRLSSSCPLANTIDHLTLDAIQRINMEDGEYHNQLIINSRRNRNLNLRNPNQLIRSRHNRNDSFGQSDNQVMARSYDPSYRNSIRRTLRNQINEDLQYYQDIRNNIGSSGDDLYDNSDTDESRNQTSETNPNPDPSPNTNLYNDIFDMDL